MGRSVTVVETENVTCSLKLSTGSAASTGTICMVEDLVARLPCTVDRTRVSRSGCSEPETGEDGKAEDLMRCAAKSCTGGSGGRLHAVVPFVGRRHHRLSGRTAPLST